MRPQIYSKFDYLTNFPDKNKKGKTKPPSLAGQAGKIT